MSFILSRIIKQRIPEWNDKIFSEADVETLCSRLEVRLIERDFFRSKGEYLVENGFCFILIRNTLPRSEKLWVTMHEIGHHLLHYPVPHKFSMGLHRRMDREANFFAALALIPSNLLRKQTLGEICEEYGYQESLIQIRKEIYEEFRI